MRAPQLSACVAQVLGADREPLAVVCARLLDRRRVADDLLIESRQGCGVGWLCLGSLDDERAGAAQRLVVHRTLCWRLQAANQECVGGGRIRAEQVGLDLLNPDELRGVRFGTAQ